MKRVFVILLCLSLLVSLLPAATLAQARPITINLDGRALLSEVPPVIVNGHTLVPMCVIFEALGAVVSWDRATQTITGRKDGKVISLIIGNRTATVSGSPVMFAQPAQLREGRTLVPLRFVGEALGAQVRWDGASRVISITSADPAARKYWPATPRLSKRTGVVSRIIDGDTIELAGGERVWFIGIDTPEQNEPFSAEATAFVTNLIAGKQITLEFYPEHRVDQFGRSVAYIWLDVGDTHAMLNAMLLREGLAVLMTFPPRDSYVTYFSTIEHEARQRQVGKWSRIAPAPTPIGRVNINTASLEELQRIVHIGPERAQEIIKLRPFRSLSELDRVSGIGPGRLADIRAEGIAYVQ